MKTHRILDGNLWVWESCKIDGDRFIRMIKVGELYGKPIIEDSAEKLVENIIKNSKKVVINLK